MNPLATLVTFDRLLQTLSTGNPFAAECPVWFSPPSCREDCCQHDHYASAWLISPATFTANIIIDQLVSRLADQHCFLGAFNCPQRQSVSQRVSEAGRQ